jgi:hypothetical protein
LDDPAIPSEYEKAEFSTFENLLCGKRITEVDGGGGGGGASVRGQGVQTAPLDGKVADCDNVEYHWLEAIYCWDQILRWFYVPYIFRLWSMFNLTLLRVILCSPLVKLGLLQSRFVYLAFRHHAENKFIAKQMLFFFPLLFGLETHVILGWLAFFYVFLTIFGACLITKFLLDNMVQCTVGEASNSQVALDPNKIWTGTYVELVRYVLLKLMWRTYLLISAQVGFNYAALLYSGESYGDIINKENSLRNSDCFYHHLQDNSLVFFNWL